MFKILSPTEAAAQIKDGSCLCISSFLSLANPDALHSGIFEQYTQTGSPSNLTLIAPAGCGGYNEDDFCEPYMKAGAVTRLIGSHFNSMKATLKLIHENKLETYCLPLGAMYHTIRAQAAGLPWHLSKVGLDIFVDPRREGPGVNSISTKNEYVDVVQVKGEEFLCYSLPKIDVALIKASSADPSGNISFDDEYVMTDAFAMAQAAHNNGGKVIVQVDYLRDDFARPQHVIIPGTIVDVVVVSPRAEVALPQLTGEFHVPNAQMHYWTTKLAGQVLRKAAAGDQSSDIIGNRAVKELHDGAIVNIGAGIPEKVGDHAAKHSLLDKLSLTVEAGSYGGVPASGRDFGAAIGPDMITETSHQFDFYDGGGIDIAFMGGLEVDKQGNVNVHKRPENFPGIGGFANITRAARKIVFCVTLCTKGMIITQENGITTVHKEGAVKKFRSEISTISFSAAQALKNGQTVFYVTDRCVFKLTEKGLQLVEVYPGIDKQRDVLDNIDFEIFE